MKRPHKYGAVATEIDGQRFASKKEAHRYADLKLLERAGHIKHLRTQPRFPMVVNGKLITTYVADFSYHEGETLIIEDVKGVQTDVFKIKAKLMAALHQIEIRIT